MHYFASTDPRKPVILQALRSRSIWPDSPEAPALAHLRTYIWFCPLHGRCVVLPGVDGLWGVGDTWNRLHVQINEASVKKNKTQKDGGGCGGWIFSSGLPSRKTTITSNIKEMSEEKLAPCFLLCLIFTGSSLHQGMEGVWAKKGEMFCVCIVYAIALMNDMVWFGLFPSPFVNSLCSFSFVLHD